MHTDSEPFASGRAVVLRLFAAWLVLLPFSTAAIVMDPLSVETLTAQADVIVHGTVLSRTCQRDPAGRIYTKVELRVAEVWKGAISGSPFLIVHGGGILGDEQARVSAQVQYAIGEEVVAFLVRNERGEGVTVGLVQGKFRVWKDAAGGTPYVVSPFHGVPEGAKSLLARPAGARASAVPTPIRLEDLKRQVQEALR